MYAQKIFRMSKIKVAHVLHCVGGVDVYLRLLLDSLDTEKFEPLVVHGECDTNIQFLNKKSNKIKSFSTTIIRNISLFNDIKAIYTPYHILKTEKQNKIHCPREKGGLKGRIVGRLLNIRTLYTPHAFSYLSAENKIKGKFFLYLEKLFSNGNSILLATSESEYNKAISEVGYIKEKALYINNAIKKLNPPYNLKIDKTWPDNYICTVGRPSYQKNIEFMVKVHALVNKYQDIHLVIMGVGHHSDKLEIVKKLIADLNLQNKVTLIDWTDRENILHIINNSKIYISTARYEGMPYSVIESLALSKPCVVSNCDGNKDIIINGYNGFVIDELEEIKFADKIMLLLNNLDLYEELSKNALNSFLENHDIDRMINRFEETYIKYSKINS